MTHANMAYTQFTRCDGTLSAALQSQNKLLLDSSHLKAFLDAMTEAVVVLNKERQIIFFNAAISRLVGAVNERSVYGMRPGDALSCTHARCSDRGCGTTEFCSLCGAFNAILSSETGKEDVKECRIIQEESGDALDFLVRATPIELEDHQFTILSLTDISHEKRRRVLERLFFHDLMNVASGIRLSAEFLTMTASGQEKELGKGIFCEAGKLAEQIIFQRDLAAAESGDLSVQPALVSAKEMVEEVIASYCQLCMSRDCRLLMDDDAEEVALVTDRTLLSRVLGNMVKNALEASNPGDTVTVGCKMARDEAQFWVHNPGVMPREVHLQLFQRSFSTKGAGRGLGTYSIKLFSKKYLKGKVSFTTSETDGTTFFASYPLIFSDKGKGQRPLAC